METHNIALVVAFTLAACAGDGHLLPVDGSSTTASSSGSGGDGGAGGGSGATTTTSATTGSGGAGGTGGGAPVACSPKQLAPGASFSCVLDDQGAVWCWGANTRGQLGNGELPLPGTPTSSPTVPVVGLGSVDAVAAGEQHACALTGGLAWCWGANKYGQLGDGADGVDSALSTPNPVPQLGAVKALAAGYGHTCALLTDGTVWCWGLNHCGQLGASEPGSGSGGAGGASAGIGCTDDLTLTQTALDDVPHANSPQQVVGLPPLPAKVADIAAAQHSTCARMESGDVFCWGSNTAGALGLGPGNTNGFPNPVPTQIPLSPTPQSLRVGHDHGCATIGGGSLECWGNGADFQLGNNSNEAFQKVVSAELDGADLLAAGSAHTCATKKTDGSLWCWGQDTFGQVGDGASAEDHAKLPSAVLGLSASVVEVAAYARHTCARTSDGGLFCWGEGSHGELGNGGTSNADTAQPVVLPCR